jgi:hypothetical protein
MKLLHIHLRAIILEESTLQVFTQTFSKIIIVVATFKQSTEYNDTIQPIL